MEHTDLQLRHRQTSARETHGGVRSGGVQQATSEAAALLELQRSAGNAAASRLLAASRAAPADPPDTRRPLQRRGSRAVARAGAVARTQAATTAATLGRAAGVFRSPDRGQQQSRQLAQWKITLERPGARPRELGPGAKVSFDETVVVRARFDAPMKGVAPFEKNAAAHDFAISSSWENPKTYRWLLTSKTPGRHWARFGIGPHEESKLETTFDVTMLPIDASKKPTGPDRPADVVEAIVHMMSNRGLWGDMGARGEKLYSPRYATEESQTVREASHVALVWEWWRLTVEDVPDPKGPIHVQTTGAVGRVRIAQAASETAALVAQLKSSKVPQERALAQKYEEGLEFLAQRAAREEVSEMINAGAAAAEKPPGHETPNEEEERTKTAAAQAIAVIGELGEVAHRLTEAHTTAEKTERLEGLAGARYEQQLKQYLRDVTDKNRALIADAPELQEHVHAQGSVQDTIAFIKGGLDAVAAIYTVTDPHAREELLKSRQHYFGRVAQGAEMNKLLWQFVSGTIGTGGGLVWAMAKLSGNAALAEGVLEATTKGIGNVAGPLALVGVIHGAAMLLDPDASAEEKAEGAVEATSSAVVLGGYAARWVPRLAGLARWSGPIAASLTINWYALKWWAVPAYEHAVVGLSRLDWVECHKELKRMSLDVQSKARELAATEAILATETDPRRKAELPKFAQGFAYDLIDTTLKPWIDARLAEDPQHWVTCGPALQKRLKPMQNVLANARGSSDAALGAAAAFLQIAEKAFQEWDKIVVEKTHGR